MIKVKTKQLWFVITFVSYLITVLWSSVAYALGMGSATAESYIGQRLSVYIPLFNVNSPENLSVILQRSQNDGLSSNLITAKIERQNSQLGIRVNSQGATSEPFVSFIVEVLDDGSATSKEFTVLLDLPTNHIARVSKPLSQSGVYVGSNVNNSTVVKGNGKPTVMGPYDWAVPGQVPETFGPVLDGQSLWRVARRINKALDVSIDQMMWSLYQNNRDQFSSNSIESLNAGAFLKIPSAQQASQVSELAAKRSIEQLSNSSVISASVPDAELDKPVKKEVSQPQQTAKSSSDDGAFELTGLSLSSSDAGSVGGIDQKSQQIISSLAESVGNLTQELIKKDQKISFLEEKISALEKYAQVNASELTSEVVVEPHKKVDIEKVLNDVIEQNSEIDQPINDGKAPQIKPSDDIVIAKNDENVADSITPSLKINEPSSFLNKSAYQYEWWHGLLLTLLLLVLFLLLFREKILSLFKQENEIEFDPTVYQQGLQAEQERQVEQEEQNEQDDKTVIQNRPLRKDKEIRQEVTKQVDPEATVENKPKLNGLSQKSILDSMKNSIAVDDALSPQTLIELDGDFSYSEMYSDDVFMDEDEVGLSFLERFNKAIQNQDFGFALQLLNMAKGNEIELPVYHYQRLRMYESMHNEDAFYDYFCEIEDQIPSFDKDLQKQVSQLVLSMAEQ